MKKILDRMFKSLETQNELWEIGKQSSQYKKHQKVAS